MQRAHRNGLIPIVVVGVLAASATGGSRASAPSAVKQPVKIMTATVPKLGVILVDAKGRTLYIFVPDKQKRVTCVGTCAAIWPPVKLAAGQKATAGGKAMASLLGHAANPAGGEVVTYKGWPLYTYVTDTAPGMAKGQALNLNGGLWYVIAPSGAVIKKKP